MTYIPPDKDAIHFDVSGWYSPPGSDSIDIDVEYTPAPDISAVDFVIPSEYTAPGINDVDFEFPATVTLNPDDCNSNITLSNGNLTATSVGTSHKCVRSNLSRSSGKFYYEISLDNVPDDYLYLGFADSALSLSSYCGSSVYSWGAGRGSTQMGAYHIGSFLYFGLPPVSTGNVLGFAIDLDEGKIWVSRNGSWALNGTGDPSAGTGAPYTSGIAGVELFPCVSLFTDAFSVTCNFGATEFAYDMPDGFSSWDGTQTPSASYKELISSINSTILTSDIDAQIIRNLSSNIANNFNVQNIDIEIVAEFIELFSAINTTTTVSEIDVSKIIDIVSDISCDIEISDINFLKYVDISSAIQNSFSIGNSAILFYINLDTQIENDFSVSDINKGILKELNSAINNSFDFENIDQSVIRDLNSIILNSIEVDNIDINVIQPYERAGKIYVYLLQTGNVEVSLDTDDLEIYI